MTEMNVNIKDEYKKTYIKNGKKIMNEKNVTFKFEHLNKK